MFYDADEPWGPFAKGNTAATKGRELCGPTPVGHLERSGPQRRKVGGGGYRQLGVWGEGRAVT